MAQLVRSRSCIRAAADCNKVVWRTLRQEATPVARRKRSRCHETTPSGLDRTGELSWLGGRDCPGPTSPSTQGPRTVRHAVAQGHFNDAYEGYRSLALDPKTEPDRVGADLRRPSSAWASSGGSMRSNAFREAVVAVHPGNWRLLQAAAESYLITITARRLHRRGQVPSRWSSRRRPVRRLEHERDRARALQLLLQGLDLAPDRPRSRRGGPLPPDARPGPDGQPGDSTTPGGSRASRRSMSCPTTTTIHVPMTRSASRRTCRARRDAGLLPGPRELRKGQERRRALAVGTRPGRSTPTPACSTRRARTWPVSCSASSALRQSPANAIGGEPLRRSSQSPRDPYASRHLGDDETIARLATGIKRFKLPDEFNPIKIYQTIADEPKTGTGGRSPGRPGVDLREPPPARPGRRRT